MGRWMQRLLGVGIIVGGFCLANQFRVDRPSEQQAEDEVDVSQRQPIHTELTLQLSSSPPSSPPSPTGELAPSGTDVAKQAAPRHDLSALPPPPRLTGSYQALAPTELQKKSGQESRTDAVEPTRRTHKIRDRDTLESLAERYFGDSQRWADIFNANRDQLTSPDLLPIGAVIIIPRQTATKRDIDLVPVMNVAD